MRNQRESSRYNYWLELPRDITVTILQKVGFLHMLMSAQLVCTQWRQICTDPSTWATIRVEDWLSYFTPQLNITSDEYKAHLENMIKQAVNQSRGCLIDLDLDEFMSEKLLLYVVERCTQIRRLRGVGVPSSLERLVPRFTLLEDLELVGDIYTTLSVNSIEILGRYCPRLCSLKIHVYSDKEAKTIARNMPQLRHICVFGANLVTDVGVEALLDGCPHLELLDIRECYISMMMNNLPLTRTQWRDILEDPSTWSTIPVKRWSDCMSSTLDDDRFDFEQHMEDLIRRAVDKSRGGLVNLDLYTYMSEDMLCYVVERCTQIRCLCGFLMDDDYSEEALVAAATRLPLLEDLEIVYCRGSTISAETVETLGRYCPRLTSLQIPVGDDEVAKALARSMPQLCHLIPLNAHRLTDVGVEALLDGCPHLESLNLIVCNRVRLYGTVGTRCAQQIKDLLIPFKPKYC